MTRNLKALGLALLAIAALGAFAASGAQAAPTFDAETGGEWHPEGKQIGANNRFELPLGRFTCPNENVKFDPVETYEGSQTEVKVTPTYGPGCEATILGTNYPVTVTHNGCNYDFHVQKKISENTYEGHVKLTCPPEIKGIEIHVYKATDTKHEETPRCTFTVKKDQTISNVITHNTGTDVVITTGEPLTTKPTTVAVTKTSGTLLQCGGENQSADYQSENTVTATDAGGKTVNATITGE